MQIDAITSLACPIDAHPLQRAGAALRCDSGHSFDVAREGHCNLLVVQHKASLDPGDSREMVAARRRFLDLGNFAPIAERVFAAAQVRLATVASERVYRIVDAGCGEGYYLERFAQLASAWATPGTLELAGIDVSKWAIKAAARRNVRCAWLVANNKRPPFPPEHIDLILCLFGFPVWDGFRSVQPSGGRVLLVDPGPDHLIELRRIIYPAVQRAPPASIAASEAAGYRLVHEERLTFSATLASAPPIQDLLAMTPHAHRLPQAGRDALARLSRLDVTVDVAVRVLEL